MFMVKTVRTIPKKGQRFYGQKERDADTVLVDQCAFIWMMKSKEKLVPDVVGHVPQKISRFVYFFLHHGGSIDAVVEDEKYRPSPIAKGGLEIVLRATFKIDNSKRSLLHRLKGLIEKNYELFYESATDEESLASVNEEDLSMVFMIDDEAEED